MFHGAFRLRTLIHLLNRHSSVRIEYVTIGNLTASTVLYNRLSGKEGLASKHHL